MSKNSVPETVVAEFPTTVAASPSLPAAIVPTTQPSLFQQMLADPAAQYVDGHSLERVKQNLIGVPFVITGAVVRDGVSDKVRGKQNYWSVELVTADADTLADLVTRGRLSAAQARLVVPNEQLVINDGSTGIARQITQYLHAQGWITVPDGPDSGPMGECRWDTYRTNWQYRDGLEYGVNPATMEQLDTTFRPLRLVCMRGLRVSEYDTEYSADGAATYYIG